MFHFVFQKNLEDYLQCLNVLSRDSATFPVFISHVCNIGLSNLHTILGVVMRNVGNSDAKSAMRKFGNTKSAMQCSRIWGSNNISDKFFSKVPIPFSKFLEPEFLVLIQSSLDFLMLIQGLCLILTSQRFSNSRTIIRMTSSLSDTI